MHLTYNFINTGSSNDLEKVIILPDNANMAILKAMVNRPDMQLKNPAKVFAECMKAGLFEELTEDELVPEAEAANFLADVWNGKVEENIFTLFAELCRMYVVEKKKIELPDVFGKEGE